MKLYTKTGDKGQTSLFGGLRVDKDHLRVEAYGTVDELNSHIGMCLSSMTEASGDLDALQQQLTTIQNRLFEIGSDLAAPRHEGSEKGSFNIPRVGAAEIAELEGWIDLTCAPLEQMKYFVLPGGTELASRLHVARCVCRRAERLCVSLNKRENTLAEVLVYLNRLSDLLFAYARYANHAAGVADVPWVPEKDG